MPIVPVTTRAIPDKPAYSSSSSPSDFQKSAAKRAARLFHANMGFDPDPRYKQTLYGPQHSSGEVVRGLSKVNDALAMARITGGDGDLTYRYPETTEERAAEKARELAPSDKAMTAAEIKADADRLRATLEKRLSNSDEEAVR